MSRLHVFSSPEPAFFVNSFVIETDNGLVLVDTQFLTSSARQLADMIRALNKPLLAIIITHPHPDHFNGTPEIVREWPNVPVYATPATIEVICATEADKRAAWTPSYGDDYPRETVIPNTPIEPNQAIQVDGLELRVDDLGAGESADITVVYLPQRSQLIASDLLYRHVHPWLAEGRTLAWLEQVATVQTRYPAVKEVFAGHGASGGLDALQEQAEYLRMFRDMVAKGVTDLHHPTEEEKDRIGTDLRQRCPGYPLEMLIPMNIDGVAKELAADIAANA